MPHEIDADFLALPLHRLADAALQTCRDAGAEYAAFRLHRLRSQDVTMRDGRVEGSLDRDDVGFSVRVVVDGTWGFASVVDLTPDEAVRAARTAIEVARVARPMSSERVELAGEPAYADRVWVSSYEVDPFDVPDAEKAALLGDWSRRLLAAHGVDHVTASLQQVKENTYYADLAGTTTTQQRVRLFPSLEALSVDPEAGTFETMRTLGPPAGRGWEYLSGTGYDWESDLAQLPGLLAEKTRAPSVQAGSYDVVIHPSNLWLTIHESIGHATELDRALGYEANYAGTSFATIDKLDTLKYGSPALNITGDRVVEHGLASVGWDDEGVEAGRWDLVRDGILVGYQLDRRIARAAGLARSNGCAYADSAEHMPIQRMANVSLEPAADDVSTADLISRVERGLYILGDKSWSIDMQRFNFQFTGQRAFLIRNGELAGQVADAAYQSNTLEFWGAMEAVGGPATWVLGGAFNCGKGQPGQVAPVSHGCPSALFRGVNILNAAGEAGR